MRVVFMGTPWFGVPSLQSLAATRELVAVYSAPDKPSGRGRRLVPSPVKSAASDLAIPVHQPAALRDPAEAARLRGLRPDVVCVAAYGLILPPAVLEIPTHGCINVHASLLPRHRGAAPIHRAVLDGDALTGVSIMLMEAGLDTGPYALQVPITIGERDVEQLTAESAILGAEALIQVLDSIESGDVSWTPQDEAKASYAAKVTRADVALSPELVTEQALRRVRASTDSAPSRVCVHGSILTVCAASRRSPDLGQGRVALDRTDLLLGLADGAISLDEVKPQGRRRMDGASFARGARLGEDARWEACR